MTTLPRRIRSVLLPLFAIAIGGCSAVVHTPYQRPEVRMPASYAHAPSHDASPSRTNTPWWQPYRDAHLDRLVHQALLHNDDLAAAALAVRIARLKAHLAGNALWPQVSASAQTGVSKTLDGSSTSTRSSAASVSVGYELDLWGKLRNYRDESRWEAAATEQDRRSAALSLTGTIVDLYWTRVYNRQRIDLARKSVAYARETLAIVRTQYEAGATSRLDVLQAQQSLAAQRASMDDLLQSQVENRNAFDAIFGGHTPDLSSLPSRLPDTAPPQTEPGLPASLLGRRPDLQAAEMRLRETLAASDYTRASYYPSLSLTGALGGSSRTLKHVLDTPVASLAATLDLPFLDWRNMHDNIRISRTQYAQSVVQFRQTLLTALSDVDNALSAQQRYRSKAHWLKQSLQAARQAEVLAEVRYKAGAIPFQTWLDSQETRREAEVALAQNTLDQLEAYATLSLALGGPLETVAPASTHAATH